MREGTGKAERKGGREEREKEGREGGNYNRNISFGVRLRAGIGM